MHDWSLGCWVIPAVLLLVNVACAADQTADTSAPSIRIVIGAKADQLERLAAGELEAMLEKLFAVSASVGTIPPPACSVR